MSVGTQRSILALAKKWRLADTECPEFWDSILADDAFKEWIRKNYQFSSAVAGNLDVVKEQEDAE
jgi:hypothetical protein